MCEKDLEGDDNRVAMCLLVDFVEEAKENGLEFYQKMLQISINYSFSENPEVRQSAVYLIGSIAEFSKNTFVEQGTEAVKALLHCINVKEKKKFW